MVILASAGIEITCHYPHLVLSIFVGDNGVLADMLQNSPMGDGLGECKKGDVVSRKYESPLDNLKTDGNYRIVAFLLKECGNGNYLVNNITECKLYGSVDYIYESVE